MQTIIYSESGKIIMTTSETGMGAVSAIEYDVPDGYYVESVNPETGEPVLAELPKTEEQQRLEALEAKQAEDDERYIDQEYRLTIMELGLTE